MIVARCLSLLVVLSSVLTAGCQDRILRVDVANQTSQRIDMLALIPLQKTPLFSDEPWLMHGGAPRLYAATIEPDATWSRARRERFDRLATRVSSGSNGNLIVMIRIPAAEGERATWQDFWIQRRRVEPTQITVSTSGNEDTMTVEAQTRSGETPRVRPLSEGISAIGIGEATFTHPPTLTAILNARHRSWPIELDLP
ncbi:MAG: hypothetical protein R3B68_08945 [Phycisphaerales bacterium]